MITKDQAKRMSLRLKEPGEKLQERLDVVGCLDDMPLPQLKEGLSIVVDANKIPSSISNKDYDKSTMHLIKHNNKQVTVKLFSEANSHEQELIEGHKHSLIDPARDRLSALHKAATDNGILIIIPQHITLNEPIAVLSSYDTNGFTHIIIIARKNSKATITRRVHEHQHTGKQGLVCEAVEIIAEEGSHITYNEHQSLSTSTSWYSQKAAMAHDRSDVRWYTHVSGADLSKQETTTTLAGREACTTVLCTTNIKGKQHNDNKMIIHHEARGTRSAMHAKAVVNDEAKTIHHGLIEIAENAKESVGYQQEDIIIADQGAMADAIPKLEIKNSEVSCTHGATIGNIEEEQVHYLRSRGMDEAQAKKAITDGFLRSITSRADDEEWRNAIMSIINNEEEERT